MTACVTAVVLGAAAFTVVGVTAASAVTESAGNSNATMTVTAHSRGVDGRFVLSGRLVPNTASGNCAANTPYLSWRVGSTSSGFNQSTEGAVRTFFADVDNPPSGSMDIDVTAQAGCTGPDGMSPNLQLTLTVDVGDLVTYQHDAVTGVAYVADDPAPDADSYSAAKNVTVDLMDVALGVAGTPVASDTTDADGSFRLAAPVDTQADADRRYKIRFTHDDPSATVVYYDGAGVGAWQSSAGDWASAAEGGPASWYQTTGFDTIRSTAKEPSRTNGPRLCYGAESSSIDSHQTSAVLWNAICETDPTFFTAELRADDMTAALAGFGAVWFDQAAGAYFVTADSFTTEESGGVLTTTLHDDDIYLIDQDVTLDVTITRTFEGSDSRWVIEVRDSGTGEIADVQFTFGGTLQNDSRTTWTRSSAVQGAWISDGGTSRSIDPREAILAHHAVADSFDLHTGRDDMQVTVEGGRLSYYLAVVDYTGCVVGPARTAALAIAEGSPADFGQSRVPLAGDACTVTWPAPRIDPMTVNVAFDQTFTVDSTVLSWARGGAVDVTDLPAGLDYEVENQLVNGVAPTFRIFGTPTAVGPFTIHVLAGDGSFRTDWMELRGAVLPPAPSAVITLNFAVGDEVAGATADVDGTGLRPDTDYTVVVESTPQTVGSGTVGADYLLHDTVTMPAGLDTGWHSITLRGNFADGTAAAERLWFRIAADGTLAQVSPTAPAGDPDGSGDPGDAVGPRTGQASTGLASTGADAAGGLVVGFLLLLGGLVVVLCRRRRSPVE